MLQNPDGRAMAEAYAVTVPQLCIRCTLQLGTVSLPKTAGVQRQVAPAARARARRPVAIHVTSAGASQIAARGSAANAGPKGRVRSPVCMTKPARKSLPQRC